MQTRTENTRLAMPDATTFVVLESASDNDGAPMTFEITMAATRSVHRATPIPPKKSPGPFNPQSYPSSSAGNGGRSVPRVAHDPARHRAHDR